MRLLLPTLGLLLLAWSGLATAANRSDFLDAMAAAQQGQLDAQPGLRARVRDYVLYDYVRAAELRQRLDTAPSVALDREIERFVAANPDLPPARSLRRNWLPSLAERGRWSTLRGVVDADDSSRNQCRLVRAKIHLGERPVADALDLWRVGRSQPDACDPVFTWLEDNGLLGADEIRRRARLAVVAGQFGLARYLQRKLSGPAAAEIGRWLEVAETPSTLRYAQPGMDGEVAAYAFTRLAREDIEAAADLYEPLTERLSIGPEPRYTMKRFLGLLYAQNHEPEALAWFARIDHARMTDDEHALGWEIRAAIYHRRWPLVLDAIEALPSAVAEDEEWRYWQARALAETGRENAARQLFEPLSRERSYHGYLAADALERDYSFNERPVPHDAAALARLRALPAMARAEELRSLGMLRQSRLEWNRVINGVDDAALAQAARIAYDWGWHTRAIITLARADYWDDLDIRYPLLYAQPVRRYAQDNALDPAYVLSIMRTESLFQPTIRSSAGAVGLMQILPATARHVARGMGSGAPPASSLTVPEVNIELGSRYLADLLARWDGNIALASASYNAGPGRVSRWLPERAMDPSIWIANIPYTETRNYVQRAMSHMTVFQRRLDGPVVPLAARIDIVRPSYAGGAS